MQNAIVASAPSLPPAQHAQPIKQLFQLHRRQQHVQHACTHLRLVETVQIFHVAYALYPSKNSSAFERSRRRRGPRLAAAVRTWTEAGQPRLVRRTGDRRAGRRQRQ